MSSSTAVGRLGAGLARQFSSTPWVAAAGSSRALGLVRQAVRMEHELDRRLQDDFDASEVKRTNSAWKKMQRALLKEQLHQALPKPSQRPAKDDVLTNKALRLAAKRQLEHTLRQQLP